MPALVFVSPEPLAGKTAVIAGLAHKAVAAGQPVALARLPGGESADADGELLASLGRSFSLTTSPSGTEVSLIEAAPGDATTVLEESPDARAIVVATAQQVGSSLVAYCQAIGDRLAGVIINKAPSKRIKAVRAAAEADGLKMLAVVPEDRLLAAPVLRDVAAILSANVEHVHDGGLQPLDRPLIATISADPGQGYFSGYDAKVVIVRSDKPDLQLAALNAGAVCLILTGGLPLLSYVIERAEEDEIPLVRTSMDTISAVNGIEGLFGMLPFAGGDAKIKRIAQLLDEVDIEPLIG